MHVQLWKFLTVVQDRNKLKQICLHHEYQFRTQFKNYSEMVQHSPEIET